MTTKRRKRHNPEQVVRKLRDADAMLNSGAFLVSPLLDRSSEAIFSPSSPREEVIVIANVFIAGRVNDQTL